jgi:heme exporter protein CcmB
MIRLLRYELRHYWSGSGSALLSLACYFILIFLMGYATQHHESVAISSGFAVDPSVAFQWIALFIASLLAFERIWMDDARDRILPHFKLSPRGLGFFIALKIIGFWISIFLPLIGVYTLQSLYHHGLHGLYYVMPFLLASLPLTLLFVLAGAMALHSQNGMLIVLLVIMPLMIPALTFGLGAHIALQTDQAMAPSLSLLAGYTLFNLVLVPCAVHYMLRHHRS